MTHDSLNPLREDDQRLVIKKITSISPNKNQTGDQREDMQNAKGNED